MNMTATARHVLQLSQPQFGAWLAEKLNRGKPYPVRMISRWENGHARPSIKIRNALEPIAARYAMEKIRPLDLRKTGDQEKAEEIIIETMR